ncbi:MAG: beta-propeller domain-containing protein [Pirellulales bacterium]
MFRRKLVESLEQRAVMDSAGLSALVSETAVAPQANTLQHFASEQELVSVFKQRLNAQYSGMFGQLVYSPIWQVDPQTEVAIDDSQFLTFASSDSDANVGRPMVADLNSAGSVGTRSTSSTSTNNQIGGIEEGDIAEITSDGIVYTVTEGRLTIVDASDPENIIALSNIDIGLYNAQLILSGNRLIVVSPSSAPAMTPWFDRVTPTWTTQLRVFDVSDKAHPKQTADMQWEGSASAVRLVGDKLVMVLNHTVDFAPRIISSLPSVVSSTGPLSPFVTRRIGDDGAGLITMDCMWYDPNARYESAEEYWTRVEPLIVTSLLPDYEFHDETGAIQSSGDAGDVHDIVALTDIVPYLAESVITIDVSEATLSVIDSETLLDDKSQSAYVSSDSVYLFSNVVWPETRFIKLDLSDDIGQVTAVAEGSVPGFVRDSHSLDEYDGMLRVLTGDVSLSWADPSTADLFVLKEIDGKLQTIGELRDIADGQQAFSIEFDGTRAVIVTAEVDRSTLVPFNDPVHGIDLSDPTAPKELGEIESPGVTTYLHWLDAQHLIGAGYVQQDGNWSLQVALIDASDLASPKIQDVWHSEPNAWIPSGNLTIDPHTFQFDDATGILTITYQSSRPIWFGNVWGLNSALSTGTQDADSMNSLVVFHVNADGINELGTIRVRDTARTAVVDDSLIVVSTQSVATYAINANLSLLDRYQITSPTVVDYATTSERTGDRQRA